MRPRTTSRRSQCKSCGQRYTSWRRLQHHWAADHAPKTAEDISRTSLHIAKTSHIVLKIHGIPPKE